MEHPIPLIRTMDITAAREGGLAKTKIANYASLDSIQAVEHDCLGLGS